MSNQYGNQQDQYGNQNQGQQDQYGNPIQQNQYGNQGQQDQYGNQQDQYGNQQDQYGNQNQGQQDQYGNQNQQNQYGNQGQQDQYGNQNQQNQGGPLSGARGMADNQINQAIDQLGNKIPGGSQYTDQAKKVASDALDNLEQEAEKRMGNMGGLFGGNQ